MNHPSPTSRASTSNTITSDALKVKSTEFDSFYDKYAAALFGEIKRSLYTTEVSEKVFAEAFIKIFQTLIEKDVSKENLFINALRLVRKEISRTKVDIVLDQILYTKKQQTAPGSIIKD